jgi:HlyD family secretion protein
MNPDPLQKLKIPEGKRSGRNTASRVIFGGVIVAILIAAFFAWPRASDSQRIVNQTRPHVASPTPAPGAASPALPPPPAQDPGVVLTTSGYIINRERIEISPRFVGVVKWIGVKKGDEVRKDQVVVLLDDSEQQALLSQAKGRLERAEAIAAIAGTRLERLKILREQRVESQQLLDDSVSELRAATAGLQEARGALELARTQLAWTVIRSPVNGVVLEKLADENELVSPQSFGGDRGPSTALLAVADPTDLQVEIDINEADLARIFPGQRCRISPEAFPEKSYTGFVAEVAPEANRQKGTLQVKVQIEKPDRWLVPELSAKVDFLSPSTPAD